MHQCDYCCWYYNGNCDCPYVMKKQAEKYKEAKEKEFPIRWGGEYNHCKLIKKHL